MCSVLSQVDKFRSRSIYMCSVLSQVDKFQKQVNIYVFCVDPG